MTNISYAQNGEDIILWRALKNISNGFYVDVGANDPKFHSVTKLFYDNGWRGINVEPVEKHYLSLMAERPRDINLQLAVGNRCGEIELWEPETQGWATVSSDTIELHQAKGYKGEYTKVPMNTLLQICEDHVDGDIHFLKVDVEGYEKFVLEGMDFLKFRPWILIVEATVPDTKEESHSVWESILLGSKYQHVYSDGLNRYYLSDEHSSLKESFLYPPNIFDDFKILDLQLAEEKNQKQAIIHQKQAIIHQKEIEKYIESEARLNSEIESLRSELESVLSSTSWRLTSPLRHMVHKIKLSYNNMWFPRKKFNDLILSLFNGALGSYLLILLNRIPWLKVKILNLYYVYKRNKKYDIQNYRSNLKFDASILPSVPHYPETLFLPGSNKDKKTWYRLVGHLEGHYSLAIVNRGLANALNNCLDQKFSFFPYHGKPSLKKKYDIPASQDALVDTINRNIPSEEKNQVVSIVHHYPIIDDTEVAGLKGIVFFWEETSIPFKIIEKLNSKFDIIWVAASSVKNALINSGCNLPVFIVPIGVDHLISEDVKPIERLSVPEEGRFRFLHISSAFERKGVDVLLYAYLESFDGNDPVELYIKTFPNPHNNVHSILAALTKNRHCAAKVVIDDSPMDDNSLIELYKSAHVMVLPSRGEGFNLPAAEAMAIGLPVITTGQSGHIDFCTNYTSTLINFAFAHSKSHLNATDACWIEPDFVDLKEKLIKVRQRIENSDSELMLSRRVGIKHIRTVYNWANCAQGIMNSIEIYEAAKNHKKETLSLSVLTPWKCRCGIAEYSDKLLSKIINNDLVDPFIYYDKRTVVDVEKGRSSWRLGQVKSAYDTLSEILADKSDVVLVQHQPSLFMLDDQVSHQLAELHKQGKVVILELHATDFLLREDGLSPKSIMHLDVLDRILVHKVEDLNNLLQLGLYRNAMLFPHGVIASIQDKMSIESRDRLQVPKDALILGSFGFALSHKGIDTIIKSISKLEKLTQREVYFIALHASLDERSDVLIRQYKTLSKKLGVEARVKWITDFQPVEQCQKILTACDYIVFPYKETKESASGAVTIGLSANRPVLVSPSDIFSDLENVTLKMADSNEESIVDAVLKLESDGEFRGALIEKQRSWLRERSWDVISDRLLSMITSLKRERKIENLINSKRKSRERTFVSKVSKQLLIDISRIYYRDDKTGIQRVVRNIINEILNFNLDNYVVKLIYFDDDTGFKYTDRFGSQATEFESDESIVVREGDLFLGLDLTAHIFPGAEYHIQKYRTAGAKVYYVVYDIIPLIYPKFSLNSITVAFANWIRSLANCSDGLICISETVSHELRNWFKINSISYPSAQVDYFHLGADFINEKKRPSSEDKEDLPFDISFHAKTFLMVGTIEPRKGHKDVLDAFDKIWDEGKDYSLILVGKEGWNISALAERIRNHKEIGNKLHWLEGLSDNHLNRLYSNCSALIAASVTEGFGLPLIEAAQHRLPIIARDIKIFREVASIGAFYFNGGSTDDIKKDIEKWVELYDNGEHPKSDSVKWLSWEQSAKLLLEKINLITPAP